MQSAAAAANLLFTLVALFALQRTRSGTMSAVAAVGGPSVEPWDSALSPPDLLLALLIAAALCVPFCYAGALALGRGCVRVYAKFSPRRLSALVVAALVVFVILLEGASGLVVLAAAVPLGLIPPLSGIKRVHLMGAVLVPVALTLGS